MYFLLRQIRVPGYIRIYYANVLICWFTHHIEAIFTLAYY